MDVVGLKVLSGFLFFVIAAFFGCLPFLIFRRCSPLKAKGHGHSPEKSKLVQCLHALASGVLIATCLLHLLPESLENVQNVLAVRKELAAPQETSHQNASESDSNTNSGSNDNENDSNGDGNPYPIAELLVAVGFLAIYIIDTTIKSAQRHKLDFEDTEIRYSHLKNDDNDEDEDEIEIFTQKTKHALSNGVSLHGVNHSVDDEHHIGSREIQPHYVGHDEHGISESDIIDSSSSRLASDHVPALQQQKGESDHVRSTALVLALCIHGFFDGIMLGLQTSTPTLYSLCVALLLHKSFVATSLSLTLLRNYSPVTSHLRVITYVILFASVAPLGIIASAAFVHSRLFTSEGDDDVSLVPGCIQAFAVGTFFYVTFTEATGRHGESRSLKTEIICHAFLLTGFFFMALMRMMLSDS